MSVPEFLPGPKRVAAGPLVVLALISLLLAACDQEPEVDATAPAGVTDLTVTRATNTSLTLRWTATGDDGSAGRAARYDIRYSTTELTEAAWNAAAPLGGEPLPSEANAADSVVVGGLSAGTTYSVGLRVADECCNWSDLSNVVNGTTVSEQAWLRVPWVIDGLGSDQEWDRHWWNADSTLSASWGPAPGADEYEYGIGSSPGTPNLVGWTSAGSADRVVHPWFIPSHGATYYFSVRARCGEEIGEVSSSDGATADLVAPVSAVNPLPDETHAPGFWVSFTGSDDLSGLLVCCIRYKDGVAGAWKKLGFCFSSGSVCFEGENGHTYYFASSGVDLAGNVEQYPEVPDAQTTIVLTDIPSVAWVDDGLGDDEDWTNSTERLSANWSSTAGVDGYECAVGQTPGGSSVVGWTPVGLDSQVTLEGLQLLHGRSYYFSVRGFVGSGRGRAATSDGITVDTLAPSSSIGALPSSVGDLGINVSWDGEDGLSGVREFDVQVRDGDAGDWQDWLTATGLRADRLYGTDGHRYCFRCRARDFAGNEEEYPQGADACTDFALIVPHVAWVNDGLGPDERWTGRATELSANWQVVAEVDGYEYAMGTFSQPTSVCGWTSAGAQTSVTRSDLNLTHGSSYTTSVRACYGTARSWPRPSDGITLDTLPPESRVHQLPDTIPGTDFEVTWSGADDLSGIATYDIQAKAGPQGAWGDWLSRTSLSSLAYRGTGGYTYYFRSRARDAAGNEEAYPDEADAATFVKGEQVPLPLHVKFALHLAAHGAKSCNNRPNIRMFDDLLRYWPGLIDLDAFMVIFDYGGLTVYEYSLDWPGEWGSCSTVICEAAGCVGYLYNPGDPGIACFTSGCKTEAANPFLVVAYHWFAPTGPGEIEIHANRATDNLGVVDCRPDDEKQEYFVRYIYNAGVMVDPFEGPPYCCTNGSGWEKLKGLFE